MIKDRYIPEGAALDPTNDDMVTVDEFSEVNIEQNVHTSTGPRQWTFRVISGRHVHEEQVSHLQAPAGPAPLLPPDPLSPSPLSPLVGAL